MMHIRSPKTSFYIQLGLIILVLITFDLFIQKYFSSTINSKFIFGLSGNNFLSILGSAIAIIAVNFIWITNGKIHPNALLILQSGIVANMIERLLVGGAIDYFEIWFLPIFNLPDVFIISGCALFAYGLIQKESA